MLLTAQGRFSGCAGDSAVLPVNMGQYNVRFGRKLE
jgi:hypothetical protein